MSEIYVVVSRVPHPDWLEGYAATAVTVYESRSRLRAFLTWLLTFLRSPWHEVEVECYPSCEHKGCSHRGNACYYPEEDVPGGYYCAEHAHAHGFCWGCGTFWGGVESFEFSRHGLCDNCKDDPDLTGDYRDEDDDYGEECEEDLP